MVKCVRILHVFRCRSVLIHPVRPSFKRCKRPFPVEKEIAVGIPVCMPIFRLRANPSVNSTVNQAFMNVTHLTSRVTLLISSLLLFAACASQRGTQGSVNWNQKKILVFTKNGKGFVHDNIADAAAAFKKMGTDHGFSVDVSNDASVFTEPNLSRYDALVFTSTNNDVFDTDAQKVALMRYIQSGGGFMGVHSAIGTERKWDWFKWMIGEHLPGTPNSNHSELLRPTHPIRH